MGEYGTAEQIIPVTSLVSPHSKRLREVCMRQKLTFKRRRLQLEQICPYNRIKPEHSKRKCLTRLHFYGDGVADFESAVHQELDRLVSRLEADSGQDVPIKDIIQTSVLRVLAILLTGRLEEADSPVLRALKDFNAAMADVFDVRFHFWTSLCPFIVHVPTTWCKGVWDNARSTSQTARKVLVDDTMATLQDGETRGIVDHILHEQRKEGSDILTDEHVWGIVLNVLIGGYLTSSETLSSIVLALLHHPDVTRRIQQEIDDVIGERQPRLDDRTRCHYTEAAMLEVNRFVCLAPLGMTHLACQDVEFRGCRIPKGTLCYSNLWHFHKSETLWGDPYNFRPERFLDDNGQLLSALHPTRLNTLSFGVGKRSCPGEMFARARIFLYVTTLLQHFDILPPAESPEQLPPWREESWVLLDIVHMKPFRCQFRKRQG